MTETRRFHWDEIASNGDAKADRREIAGSGGSLKRVAIAGGTKAERHAHDFEQFFLVQEGCGVLTCADGEIPLYPGVVIHFAPNAWHSAVFETDTVLIEVNFANGASVG